MNILTLNAGSATLKFKLFAMPAEDILEVGGLDHPGGGGIIHAAEAAIEQCNKHGIDALGHRVVHGGARFLVPERITPAMLDELRTLEGLDPLHNPTEIAMITAGLKQLPATPAVAVFDTSFHRTMPEIAWRYGIPHDLTDKYQLRRYGFHGLSYQYVSECLLQNMGRDPAGSRLIVCHLGSGASICAIKDGKSVETSMGMTPLSGLIMGTRAGDIDPGLLLYLLRKVGMSADDIDDVLNYKSGLLGLSNLSSDVRELEKAASTGNQKAELALEAFAYRVSKYIGSYAAVLGGVDAVAFTGGIGEHSADIRSRVSQNMELLGIELDSHRNETVKPGTSTKISVDSAKVQLWVIPTDEELQAARETYSVLQS